MVIKGPRTGAGTTCGKIVTMKKRREKNSIFIHCCCISRLFKFSKLKNEHNNNFLNSAFKSYCQVMLLAERGSPAATKIEKVLIYDFKKGGK